MPTSTHHPPHPVYIRMPRYGTACPHSSLSRSAIDLLVRPQPKNEFKPPVRSKIFRAEGKGKGIRLVEYASLMAYLGRLPITQSTEAATRIEQRKAELQCGLRSDIERIEHEAQNCFDAKRKEAAPCQN